MPSSLNCLVMTTAPVRVVCCWPPAIITPPDTCDPIQDPAGSRPGAGRALPGAAPPGHEKRQENERGEGVVGQQEGERPGGQDDPVGAEQPQPEAGLEGPPRPRHQDQAPPID